MPSQRKSARRQSVTVAFCGMAAALSVVIMLIGGVIPAATYAVTMLCGTLFIKFFPNLLVTIGGFSFCNIQVLMWVESFGRVLVGLMVLRLLPRVEPDAA